MMDKNSFDSEEAAGNVDGEDDIVIGHIPTSIER